MTQPLPRFNHITDTRFEAEVGVQPTLSDLGALARFCGASIEPGGTLSPSIVTRSEAQLFGLSVPRFAIRIHLTGAGFVNCRRLSVLKRTIPADSTKWGRRYEDSEVAPHARNELLSATPLEPPVTDWFQFESCVADSLLMPPIRLRRYGFRYLSPTGRLQDAYGEAHPGSTCDTPLLPYVKSFNLGGGLCGQATCYMATACLSEYAAFVCGLGEITALAHEPDCQELSLSGLTSRMMQRYFEGVGLRFAEQTANDSPTSPLDESEMAAFGKAIDGYICSNFPVILPVDFYRLAYNEGRSGKSVYLTNGVTAQNLPRHSPNANHAVMIVGHTENRGSPLLVFHDPAALPYMVATLDELARSGAVHMSTQQPEGGVIMPVTPTAARLPLLTERASAGCGRQSRRLGLLSLAAILHSTPSDGSPYPLHQPHECAYYRLLRFDPLRPQSKIPNAPETDPLLLEELAKSLPRLAEFLGLTRPRWLWLEFIARSIWIWDAEALALDLNLARGLKRVELMQSIYKHYLLGFIYLTAEGCKHYPES